ncbi:hypothetical protein AOQ84DRAFT_94727 [Glonium stellatum]|uniref:Uncharacterized protein n=1 Tax=Glonium stellatum TaxID=574774 RepID=A0A8E2EVB7_9PEZI|nr:hypothetical protein AOQ84DRAFT_94727 [Glonium stellatum]
MRSSISLAVIAAVAAPALAVTSIQPITQISDGQIQAPPATSAASYEASSAVVVPTTVAASGYSSYSIPVVSPPIVTSVAPVVSSVPVVVPTYAPGNTSIAVTIPTYTNTTLASVAVGSATVTGPAGTSVGAISGTSAAASASGTGAADSAFGSPLGALSYVAVAVAGFFLA